MVGQAGAKEGRGRVKVMESLARSSAQAAQSVNAIGQEVRRKGVAAIVTWIRVGRGSSQGHRLFTHRV